MNRKKLETKFAEEDLEARRNTFKALMQHQDGRKFIWWLLETGCAINFQPFTANALTMSFNCGRMEVGNTHLAALIDATGPGFTVLMQEIENERAERKRRLAEAPGTDADGDYD